MGQEGLFLRIILYGFISGSLKSQMKVQFTLFHPKIFHVEVLLQVAGSFLNKDSD